MQNFHNASQRIAIRSALHERKAYVLKNKIYISVWIRGAALCLACISLICAAISLATVKMMERDESRLAELRSAHIQLTTAADSLMNGSDYLTAEVRYFVITHNRQHMDNYWDEVNITQSRDKALKSLDKSNLSYSLIEYLTKAKSESDALIGLEILAMKLISENIGIPDSEVPGEVAAYTIPPVYKNLSAENKYDLSVNFVFGNNYKASKNRIRGYIDEFKKIEKEQFKNQETEFVKNITKLNNTITTAMILCIVMLISAVFLFYFGAAIQIRYLNKEIKNDRNYPLLQIPRFISLDLKDLTLTINSLSTRLKMQQNAYEHLQITDEITGLPHRKIAIEYIQDHLEKKAALAVLIIRVNDFSTLNSKYGYLTGDQILQEVANKLSRTITPQMGVVSRLTGPEFMAVLSNTDEEKLQMVENLIISKISTITGSDIGIKEVESKITARLGHAFWDGEQKTTEMELFKKAGRALISENKNVSN